jgi:hypothetical protein
MTAMPEAKPDPAPVPVSTTPPKQTPSTSTLAFTTSYHRDIRPVIEGACLACHVSGGVGPFALDSWKAVRSVAPIVVNAVYGGAMPPWPADDSCHSLRDTRALSATTRELFMRWKSENYPEGNPLDYVAPPSAAKLDIGPPTLTLEGGAPYTPPNNADDYRCFVTSYVFDKDTYITAVDILPDQHAEVHHVQVHSITAAQRDQLQALDLFSAASGYNCNVGLALTQNMFSWRPGSSLVAFDKGDAAYLPAGSSIMLQVHYNTQFLPNGNAPTPDQTHVQLWTLPDGELPDRVIYRQMILLPLVVPAGESHEVVEASLSMADLATVGPTGEFVPGEIIGMTPHAHQIASEMAATLLPSNGGTEQCLVSVPKWDFGWQLDYLFHEAVPYSRTDLLHAVCVYDNGPEHQPIVDGVKQQPKRVHFGENSLDEMCLHYVWLRMDREAFLGDD